MFTPSILLLMVINTAAASGAVLTALHASALKTGDRLTSRALATRVAGISQAGFQDARFPGSARKSEIRNGCNSPPGTFLLAELSAPSEVLNHSDEFKLNLYGG